MKIYRHSGTPHTYPKVVNTSGQHAGCAIVANADSYKKCADVGVDLATKSVNWQMKDANFSIKIMIEQIMEMEGKKTPR